MGGIIPRTLKNGGGTRPPPVPPVAEPLRVPRVPRVRSATARFHYCAACAPTRRGDAFGRRRRPDAKNTVLDLKNDGSIRRRVSASLVKCPPPRVPLTGGERS